MAKDELDLTQVTQAVAEIKTAFEAFKEADAVRVKELAKGALDPLLEEKMGKINAEMDKHQELIDKLYASTRRKHVTVDGEAVDVADLDKKAHTWANMIARQRGTRVESFTHEDMKSYKTAFEAYLRKDERTLSGAEAKALSAGSDPDGGYLVTPDTSGRIVKRQFLTSQVRQYASVQVITTDMLEGLFDLDEATSGWVSETGSRPETNTPQLRAWRIPVHEQYARPRATQKILDDSSIDIEAWLATKVADKLTRTENTAFVNGTGVGQPRGIMTYPAGTGNPGQIEQIATGVNGAFAAAPGGFDTLITTVHRLKTSYLPNSVWFMNRVTQGVARTLKNSEGQYIWQPSVVAGAPSTLLSYPVAIFEDMVDSTTAGGLAIGFGDLAEAYQIVDRLGVRVLRDPYSVKPFVEFYTTKRVGGDVINFEALKLIRFGT